MIYPADVPITAWRTVTYVEDFVFTDEFGAPVDFLGYTAKMEARLYPGATGAALMTITQANQILFPGAGTIRLVLTQGTLDTFPAAPEAGGAGLFSYDLILTPPVGVAAIWMAGTLTLKPGVTRP